MTTTESIRAMDCLSASRPAESMPSSLVTRIMPHSSPRSVHEKVNSSSADRASRPEAACAIGGIENLGEETAPYRATGSTRRSIRDDRGEDAE